MLRSAFLAQFDLLARPLVHPIPRRVIRSTCRYSCNRDERGDRCNSPGPSFSGDFDLLVGRTSCFFQAFVCSFTENPFPLTFRTSFVTSAGLYW